jgi:dTDP-4-dehydrorhamnose 3,5-epimerase
MIFNKTSMDNAFTIDLDRKEDNRGFFARSWDVKNFEENGLNPKIVQCNISYTKKKGTIRGMHFQKSPYEEAKLIRCTKGKIFDVIIDLRKNSKTYKKWESFKLSSTNFKMLYVPEGFAHGFQSLKNDTEILYQVSQFYSPEAESGIRWNDPHFDIRWPIEISEISDKDNSIGDFSD